VLILLDGLMHKLEYQIDQFYSKTVATDQQTELMHAKIKSLLHIATDDIGIHNNKENGNTKHLL
jgi:hypothetical protein